LSLCAKTPGRKQNNIIKNSFFCMGYNPIKLVRAPKFTDKNPVIYPKTAKVAHNIKTV
jgi:hypothetical protein